MRAGVARPVRMLSARVQRLQALVHADLGVLEPVVDHRRHSLESSAAPSDRPEATVVHERADVLAEDHPLDASLAMRSKTTMGMRLSMHRVIAVLSMTLEPPVEHLKVGEVGQPLRLGYFSGRRCRCRRLWSPEHHLGADLRGAQGRGGVGGEERVAGARADDDDAALLEMADRAAADVRLGTPGAFIADWTRQ